MSAIQRHHIVDLFVFIDDVLPQQPVTAGRKPTLSSSELLTILIWDGLTEPHKNLKSVHNWIEREYSDYFPRLPSYKSFVLHCHRLLPMLVWLLQSLLATNSPLVFADSTMLPVCKPIRADRHRVAKGVAAYGKNWQGWHYGFKLHASVDHKNRLTALVFTPASEHDNQHMEKLVNEHTKVLVGDSHYGGSVMRKRLWKKHKTIIIAPPHHTQRKKIITDLQLKLLQLRPKVEAAFGVLKEHHFLVTSFPRSVTGYFVHYLRCLLGYQVGAIS
jgi:hypothetical protein